MSNVEFEAQISEAHNLMVDVLDHVSEEVALFASAGLAAQCAVLTETSLVGFLEICVGCYKYHKNKKEEVADDDVG